LRDWRIARSGEAADARGVESSLDFNEFAKFGLLGLGQGSAFAIAGLGLVLIYRGSGVLNFAHGAMALFSAAFFVELREKHGYATWLAIVVALLVTVVLGIAIHLLVMRPLRRASPLARLVATLGVLGVIQALANIRYKDEGFLFVGSFLPSGTVEPMSGVLVGEDRFWVLGIAIVLTAALWATYRHTSFGRSTAAVAENQRSASSLGISPDLIAGFNWALGGVMAGAAGILFVTLAQAFDGTTVSTLILPALAAAMVGGFSSFPLTLVGGVGIGVAESVFTAPSLSHPGWSDSFPFLVIIAILVLRGRALPLRGYLGDRLPMVGRRGSRAAATIGGVVVASVLILTVSTDGVAALTTSFIVGLVCLSVVVVTGLAGQVSLAQYAFAGIGTLAAARLAATQDASFFVALLFAIAVAVPVGLLFALPALRTRGVNLAIATLGLALVVDKLVLGNRDYTGGYAGTTLDPPKLFGWDIYSVTHPERYAFVALAVFALFGLAVANVRRGRVGRRLLATRANERAAASLGISIMGAKLYAFALAAGIASAAGALMAFRLPAVQFNQFDVFQSINIVVLTFLGGVGFIFGAILGGALAIGGAVTEFVDAIISFDKYATLVTSATLIIVVIVDPNGIARRQVEMAGRVRRSVVRRFVRTRAVKEEPAHVVERCEPRVLSVDGLTVRFGGVVALDGVSLRVEPGQILGLIGPNGAGKTTLIDAVTGFSRASSGEVSINDEVVRARSPRRRVQLGIGRTFQNLELFEDMTVADNLRAACERRDWVAYLSDLVRPGAAPLPAAALEAVRSFQLGDDLERRPGELAFGKRRLLAIARTTAARPSILLLDEPAAGLDDDETNELGDLLRHLADDWGISVVLVEHDMGLVMRVCDRIVVLDFGTKIAEGTPEEVRRDDRVIAAYLGADAQHAPEPSIDASPGTAQP
jgi:ABC-type branched-subunit amino acid transport system ATPase component/branched-subunit amino acid ABC-type transport system permease component